MDDKRKYLVTVTETVTVWARSESEATFLAEQTLAFVGPDTEDLDVEEVED